MTRKPPHNHGHDPTPSITIDWDFYAQFLEDVDMSDDETLEFLQALVSIVIGFVDLGFNVHPAQLATKDAFAKNQTCGSIADRTPNLPLDVLGSHHANHTSKNDATTARSK
ncbi:hypothetical protein GN278_07480 [Rhodobacteraceae bacterium Araon29]